ncbi:hypothetical protein [Anaerocolumna chitinilytica]|uniref:Uncharacterized protein n=1 Tax=Anaerocolumna chitinilytica TaxID=1727145 RepID=A0A7I8DN02_9FIRM|nr:hypothetical protein [Anaerocolumna chitinilytica]BCJ98405.1 hypothetical protein bsdcttw_14460 [Anaerocolumna chitinilytica]
MEIRKRLQRKLIDKKGFGLIEAVVIFLFVMILISVAFEYLRVQIIANGVRDSFERASLTVAAENYNEVYAGFREEYNIGGFYDGGPAGGGNQDEVPEWVAINDYGDVEDELRDLLKLKEVDNAIKNDKDNYTLENIQVEVNNSSVNAGGRYEIRGKLKLILPLHFAGVKIMDINLPVSIQTAYTPKY